MKLPSWTPILMQCVCGGGGVRCWKGHHLLFEYLLQFSWGIFGCFLTPLSQCQCRSCRSVPIISLLRNSRIATQFCTGRDKGKLLCLFSTALLACRCVQWGWRCRLCFDTFEMPRACFGGLHTPSELECELCLQKSGGNRKPFWNFLFQICNLEGHDGQL